MRLRLWIFCLAGVAAYLLKGGILGRVWFVDIAWSESGRDKAETKMREYRRSAKEILKLVIMKTRCINAMPTPISIGLKENNESFP